MSCCGEFQGQRCPFGVAVSIMTDSATKSHKTIFRCGLSPAIPILSTLPLQLCVGVTPRAVAKCIMTETFKKAVFLTKFLDVFCGFVKMIQKEVAFLPPLIDYFDLRFLIFLIITITSCITTFDRAAMTIHIHSVRDSDTVPKMLIKNGISVTAI